MFKAMKERSRSANCLTESVRLVQGRRLTCIEYIPELLPELLNRIVGQDGRARYSASVLLHTIRGIM